MGSLGSTWTYIGSWISVRPALLSCSPEGIIGELVNRKTGFLTGSLTCFEKTLWDVSANIAQPDCNVGVYLCDTEDRNGKHVLLSPCLMKVSLDTHYFCSCGLLFTAFSSCSEPMPLLLRLLKWFIWVCCHDRECSVKTAVKDWLSGSFA